MPLWWMNLGQVAVTGSFSVSRRLTHRALPGTSEEPPPLPNPVRQDRSLALHLYSGKSSGRPLCHAPTSPLPSLSPPLLASPLSATELRARCAGQGRRPGLPAVSAYACRKQAGSKHCPPCDGSEGVPVAKQRSPACPRGSPPWHGDVCPPASTRPLLGPCRVYLQGGFG